MNYYFIEITNTMWPLIMKFHTIKLLWIFLFIIMSTTAFLIIVYKSQKDELKKFILHGLKSSDESQAIAICNRVHSQLQNLSENLLDKEEQLNKSRGDLKCAEKVLDFIENNKVSSVSRYKQLLSGLKDDLENIEHEIKELQTEITGISMQRKNLKIDVLQHQEDYQQLFFTFANQLNIDNNLTMSINPQLKFNINDDNST